MTYQVYSVRMRGFGVEFHQVFWKTFDFAKNGCRVSASETNLKKWQKCPLSSGTESGRFCDCYLFRAMPSYITRAIYESCDLRLGLD
jgi:hypothetical protein